MSASLSSVRKAKPARANNRRGETLWSIRLIRTKLVFAVTAAPAARSAAERPRLDVFRSAKHIYCQVIDDEAGVTLASASTLEKDFEDYGGNCDAAKKVGERIAKKCLEKGITEVVYDRGGFVYHGRVKALAEGAREAGLKL